MNAPVSCRSSSAALLSTTCWLVIAASLLSLLTCAAADTSPSPVDDTVRSALQLDSSPKRGAKLYAANCAQCHGAQALGSAEQFIPSLAGQRRAYLIKQLAEFTALQRESPTMHAVVATSKLAKPQVWADVAAYLTGLKPLQYPEAGDGQGTELGEAIFQEQCASCHEEDARGDDERFVPSLRNQHYSYLLRQTRSIASWHRHSADADLVRFLDSLDNDEMTSVADYLARMRDPDPEAR